MREWGWLLDGWIWMDTTLIPDLIKRFFYQQQNIKVAFQGLVEIKFGSCVLC